jgi:hypothetical protein
VQSFIKIHPLMMRQMYPKSLQQPTVAKASATSVRKYNIFYRLGTSFYKAYKLVENVKKQSNPGVFRLIA